VSDPRRFRPFITSREATTPIALKPQSTPNPWRVWTAVEAQRFLAKSQDDTLGPFWLVIVTTGLRHGEALGLRWEDIDLDRSTLCVRHSVVILAGKNGEKERSVIQEPK